MEILTETKIYKIGRTTDLKKEGHMILYSKYTLGQGEERERQVLKVVGFFLFYMMEITSNLEIRI